MWLICLEFMSIISYIYFFSNMFLFNIQDNIKIIIKPSALLFQAYRWVDRTVSVIVRRSEGQVNVFC